MVLSLEFARELIAGRDDFMIKSAPEGYTVIDYLYATPDTFADQRRLELRGIKFDTKTGEVLALPFHKFFNACERPETQLGALPWHRSHDVLEKLDGSMVHGILLGDRVRLMTRAGLTDTAIRCEKFWGDVVQGWRAYIECGLTPIFEWIGPHNPHIVKYPRDQLILTGLRCMLTGSYYQWEALRAVGDQAGFQTVQRIKRHSPARPTHDAHKIFDEVRGSRRNEEGVVIAWDHTDLRVKIKTEHYTSLHRAKDDLSREKDAALLVLDKRVDDVVGLLDNANRSMVESYSTRLNESIERLGQDLLQRTVSVPEATRKIVATTVMPGVPKRMRGAFWKIYDGADHYEAVLDALKSYCRSGPEWDATAADLNLPRWSGLNAGGTDSVDAG